MFNIENSLDTLIKGETGRFKSAMQAAINLVAATANLITPEVMVEELMKKGGEGIDHETAESVVKRLYQRLTDVIISQSGGSVMLKDILEVKPSDMKKTLKGAHDTDLGAILNVIGDAQTLYSKVLQRESMTDILDWVTGNSAKSDLFGAVQVLYKTLQHSDSPRIPVNGAYALNQLGMAVFDRPYVSQKPLFRNILYEIEEINFLDDLRFKELLTAHLLCIRGILGMSVGKKGASIEVNHILEKMIVEHANLPPYILAEAAPEKMDNSQRAIVTTFFMYMFNRVLSNDFGTFENRFWTAVVDAKYKRGEAWEPAMLTAVRTFSIIFEAFTDAAAFLKTLVQDKRLYTTDVRPDVRTKISDASFSYLEQYKNFRVGADHPAFWKEPAHIINKSIALTPVQPDYVIPAQQAMPQNTLRVLTDTGFVETVKSRVMSGNLIKAPLKTPEDLYFLMQAPQVTPFYYYDVPMPTIHISGNLILPNYGVFFITPKMFSGKAMQFWELLQSLGSIEMITSSMELADLVNLPYEMADGIYQGPGAYLVIRQVTHFRTVWSSELAPIYEMTETVEDLLGRIDEDFVSVWPFLLKRTLVQPRLLIENKNKKPAKPARKPKPDPEDEDSAGGDDPDGSGSGDGGEGGGE